LLLPNVSAPGNGRNHRRPRTLHMVKCHGGRITHLWFTVNAPSADHLRDQTCDW